MSLLLYTVHLPSLETALHAALLQLDRQTAAHLVQRLALLDNLMPGVEGSCRPAGMACSVRVRDSRLLLGTAWSLALQLAFRCSVQCTDRPVRFKPGGKTACTSCTDRHASGHSATHGSFSIATAIKHKPAPVTAKLHALQAMPASFAALSVGAPSAQQAHNTPPLHSPDCLLL